METYQEFLDRINSFEKAPTNFGNEYFMGNPSISQKVGSDNSFKKFYGDTVVFALDDTIKRTLAECVDLLYQTAPKCFCQKLSPNTFHVTLHDLSNSAILQNVEKELLENKRKIIAKSGEVQRHANEKIKMKSNSVFNMVDTSLVLGLYPASENDYCRIMELYALFDDVKKLNYPFTPHITLAYYNVNGFDLQSAKDLENIVKQLNANDMEIELEVKNLYYQQFKSMNDYFNIVKLAK
ncbi:MAG: ligT like phosphoesterase [Clostridia bacterium]|nr:ligT like phosphoesterase [Clostridia bacterium]